MQTNPAVEQNKNIEWSESQWNQSGRKVKSMMLTDAGSIRHRPGWQYSDINILEHPKIVKSRIK